MTAMQAVDTDVVIVGAGPAGAAAALTFATTGCRVIWIERAPLPRSKPCGGAIPTRTWVDWAEHAGDTWHRPVTETVIQGPSAPHPQIRLPTAMTFVDRAGFDAALAASAKRIARSRLAVLTGVGAISVTETGSSVTITLDDGRQVTSAYLVAADGATSRLGRLLGILPLTSAVAVAAEVEAPPKRRAPFTHSPLMDLSAIPGGYGWIFPGRKQLTCGIGTWLPRPGIRQSLTTFIQKQLPHPDVRIRRWRAAPLPVYQPSRPTGTSRICLTGDAAGLVDPVSGEGIHYALESGRLAAKAILSAGGKPVSQYADSVQQEMGTLLTRLVGFAQPMLVGAPDRFFDQLTRAGDYHGWFSEGAWA